MNPSQDDVEDCDEMLEKLAPGSDLRHAVLRNFARNAIKKDRSNFAIGLMVLAILAVFAVQTYFTFLWVMGWQDA